MKIIFLASIVILVTFTTSFAEFFLTADDTGKFTGNLQKVSLLEVKSFFEENYGIKFIGNETLFQTELTISFTRLNLEKTLKRIFSRVNIAFKYNSQGKITVVNLLPTSQKQTKPVTANLARTNDQQPTLEPAQDPFLENNTDLNDSPKIMAEDPNNQVKDEITDFQVVPNSPPPGDAIKDDPNDGITSFQIVPNSPPPGDSSATGPVSLPSADFSENGPGSPLPEK